MDKDDTHPEYGALDEDWDEGGDKPVSPPPVRPAREVNETELDLSLPIAIARMRAQEPPASKAVPPPPAGAAVARPAETEAEGVRTEIDLAVRHMSAAGRSEAARPTMLVERPRIRPAGRGSSVLVIVAVAIALSAIAVAIVYFLGGGL